MEEGTLSMMVTLPVGHTLHLELPVDGRVLAGDGVLVLIPWLCLVWHSIQVLEGERVGVTWVLLLRAGERNPSSESVLLRRWYWK